MANAKPKFPCRVKVPETRQDPGGDYTYWKTLCLVFDNEALGLLERALKQVDIDYNVVEV